MKRLIILSLITNILLTPVHAGLFKRARRAVSRTVKKVIKKPIKAATAIIAAPTAAVVALVTKPKETLKNPKKNITNTTNDILDTGKDIINTASDTALDGIKEVGEGIEDVAEPLADEVSVGGGIQGNSDGEISITDSDGNPVTEKPTDPSDLTSESFDWEAAIQFSKDHELNDFLKSDEFNNKDLLHKGEMEVIRDLAQKHIKILQDLSLQGLALEDSKMLTLDIQNLQNDFLDFSKGTSSPEELMQQILTFKRKYELNRSPAFNVTTIAVQAILASLIIPSIKFITTVIKTSQTLGRITEIRNELGPKIAALDRNAVEIDEKLDKLGWKMINLLAKDSQSYYKNIYSVFIKSRIPGEETISDAQTLAKYLLKETIKDTINNEIDKLLKESLKEIEENS